MKPVINYVLSTEQSGETVEVTLISATNATVIDEASDVGGLAKPSVTANVISGNIAPVVSFMISQAEAGDNGAISNVSTIAGAGGLVTVTANISDINTKDEHCITFTSLDSSLVESVDMADECRLLNTFTFDPSTLTSGTYTLETSVVESNTDVPFTTEVSIKLAVIAGSVEVIADSDSDGVPDSQENTATMNDATQLPVKDDEAPLQIAAGLSLSLGDIAKSNTDNNGFVATVERDQVQDDLHYSAISTITNFNVSGLQQLGDSVSVVIPLAEDVVIPANAVYRKYTELNGDWFDFVIDENNQVASAFKDAQGNCPAPNSVNYSTGLTEGNGCIQLTIEDGGLNDGDSMANGRIVDPGVLVIENENTPPEIISLTTHATNSGDEFSLNAIVVDLEQDEITYSWGQVDTGSTLLADVVEANTKTGVFIAPVTAEPTELTFSLTITDSYGGSSSKEFVVKVETINLKPDHEVDRKAGSFGCFFVLITLAGLVTRRIRKYK